MALGTGSALAHRAVDAVLGSRHPPPAQATAAAEELVRDNAPCSEQVGRGAAERGGAGRPGHAVLLRRQRCELSYAWNPLQTPPPRFLT